MYTNQKPKLMATPNNNQVSVADFDPNKVRTMSYVSKQIPAPKGGTSPGSYCEIPIQYNYGTDENQMFDDLRIELPIVKSNGGILYGQQNGKVTVQMPISLPMTAGSETHQYVEKMNNLWLTLAFYLHQVKGQVQLGTFLIYNPADKSPDKMVMPDLVETKFRCPIYFTKDNGEIVAGKPATQYLKLYQRGSKMAPEKTLFTDLDGKAIDWNLLQSVEMDCVPLLHIKKIYVGGDKARLQSEVISAVVLPGVVSKGTTSRQMGTIEKLRAQGFDASALRGQLSTLASERQNSSLAAAGAANPTPLVPNSGTMESIGEGDAPAAASANPGLSAVMQAPKGSFSLPPGIKKL